MTQDKFIEQVAKYVKKYAPKYGIKVYSPIIAQACLESAYGTSLLAQNHNYFGLKYRKGRCPTYSGTITKQGSEQSENGLYSTFNMLWFKFPDMEKGIIGYFDFTNISTYYNLKGVTDPKTYLENIKSDGYATSLNYVENLMKVIKNNNLTRFDNTSSQEEEFLVKVTITDLNIRSGPGVNYSVIKVIPVGKYTIVETQGSWGKLKSGIGWINTNYTERV